MRSIALASVAVPTVERGSAPIRCWSTMIAVVSPSRTSTSGRARVGMKPCTKALYVSLISRCDSAAIVSNTRELLPEPETPVNTVNRRFGISILTSLRLFSRRRVRGSDHGCRQRAAQATACPSSWPCSSAIQVNRGANERHERLFIDLVALVEVDGTASVAVKARVEQPFRIVQGGTLGEGHFDLVGVCLTSADHSVVVPRGHPSPFPFLDHVGIRLLDEPSYPSKRVAPPIRELLDPCVDQLRGRVGFCHGPVAFCLQSQRSSWIRTMLPAGSRRAQSRTPYGCSVGSWTISTSPDCSFSKVPSRYLVASRSMPYVPLAIIAWMTRRSSSVRPGVASGGYRTILVSVWFGGPTVVQRILPPPTSRRTSKPRVSR